MTEAIVKYLSGWERLLMNNRLVDKIKASPHLYRMAKGSFWSLVGTVTTKVFSVGTTIFIARLLGKEDYGAYGMVQSTLGMFGLFAGFAMGSTMTKYVAEFREKDPDKAGRILSLTRVLSVLTSGLIAVVLIFMASWLANATLKRPDLSPYIASGAILLFVSTLNSIQAGALAGFEAFRATARINTIQGITAPIVSVPFVYFFGIQGAIVSLIVQSAVGYLLCNVELRRECNRYGIKSSYLDRRFMSEWPVLWKFSFPALLSGMLVVPVTWITNTMLVNQHNGYSELGLFNAANQWRQFIIFIPQVLGSVMLPIFSDTYARSDKKDFVDAYTMNLRLTWAIALPVTVVVIGLRHPLSQLYGSQYAGTSQIITLLMATSFLNIINNVIGFALEGSGRMWLGTSFNLAWAFALIGATVYFVPVYGGYGLALSYLIAYLLHTIYQMVYAELTMFKSVLRSNLFMIVITMVTLVPQCLLDVDSLPVSTALSIIAFIPLYKIVLSGLAKTGESRSEIAA